MTVVVEPKVPAPIVDLLARTRVHDVDTHIGEPPDLWTSRMSPKWGELIPQKRIDPDIGVERWFIAGEKGPFFGDAAASPFDEETSAGASDPKARLTWMDKHGVFSQVLYPNILGFFPRAFMRADRKFSIECVRTYNDFQTEFASADPDRLIPIAYLPWWDLEASVVELERCYALGHKGVNFAWEFEKTGLPRLRDEYWEPVLKRAEEMDLAINFHVGFNTEDLDLAEVMAAPKLDQVTWTAKFFTGNIHCIAELIMGRICHNYPGLNFVSVESGMGFIPYLIEALDWQFLNNNLYRDHPDMLLPSEYFRRQVYGTFWFEQDVANLAELYPDNFMFESDYPHSTSLTPAADLPHVRGPRDTIIANLSEVPEDLLLKLLHDNAARVYHLL